MEPDLNQGVPREVLLKTLWDTKHYRVYPIAIMQALRHSALSSGAILCWQTLFKLAYFDPHWTLVTSTTKLARLLQKSTLTVKRCLKELEKGGYIRISLHPTSSSLCIKVGFPQDEVDSLLKNEPIKRFKQKTVGLKKAGEDALLVKLKLLWETRFFYALPCPLFDHLLRSGLPDSVVLCWQALLEKASLAPDFSVVLSVRALAQALNKSESRVSDYLKCLEEKGYLIRTQTGTNTPDCLSLVLPDAVLSTLIEQTPNRAVATTPTSLSSSSNVPRHVALTPQKTQKTQNACSVFEWGCSVFVAIINTILDTHTHQNKNNSNTEASSSVSKFATVVFSSSAHKGARDAAAIPSSPCTQTTPALSVTVSKERNVQSLQAAQEKRLKPLKDRLVHKVRLAQHMAQTNNTKTLDEPCQTTISLHHDLLVSLESEVKALQEALKHHLGLKSLANVQALRAIQKDAQAKRMNARLAELSHRMVMLQESERRKRAVLVRQEQQTQAQRQEAKWLLQLAQDKRCLNQQTGGRALTEEQLTRLEQCLRQLGFSEEGVRYRLMNEVVYEIRFGSLVHGQTTQKEQPTEKALNIALKLIREGRWNEPTRIQRPLKPVKEQGGVAVTAGLMTG